MRSLSRAARRFRYPATLFVLATLYFLAGRLGLSLASVHPSTSAVWPPTGIAMAAVALLGIRVWPAIFVGALFVNLVQTGHLPSSLGIAFGNTAEALAGAWFLGRAGGGRAFTEPRTIFKFILLSGILSTALSALTGSAMLYLGGLADAGELPSIALNWWVGDMNSALILTPILIMSARSFSWRLPTRMRMIEALLLAVGLVLVHVVVFGGAIPGFGRLYLLGYLGIPLFLCVAFRFGPFPAALSVAGISVIAIWATVESRGPFAPENPDLSLVLLQLYLGSLSVTMLTLAAVVWSRKRAQAELDWRQKRLDSIISSVPGTVWEAWRHQDKAALRLDYVSPYVQTMTGYSDAEWLSTPDFWLSIIHPQDRERVAREANALFEEGKGGMIAFRWITKDGRVVDVETRLAVILDAAGRPEGMLGVTMDISERRKAEERQRLTGEQLRYTQKMEAVGRLASGVAHDFNNLLTSILGYSDLLLAQSQPGSSAETYAKEVHSSGEKAAELTRQLLAFSRKEVTQPDTLHLNTVVVDMETELFRIIGGTIRIKESLDPDLWLIRADRGQMMQLVMNLVMNSRDAMPDGGSIAIETANVRISDEPDVFILKPRTEFCVRLTIRDEGVGIGKDAMEHLFEPFFSTKRLSKGKGVGLGLSTVYGILERNGGGVQVISEPGRGCTFHLYLPKAAKEGVMAHPVDAS